MLINLTPLQVQFNRHLKAPLPHYLLLVQQNRAGNSLTKILKGSFLNKLQFPFIFCKFPI